MSEQTLDQRVLQRWQQTDDDELLYAADPGYGTVEEAVHAAMASARCLAAAHQQPPDAELSPAAPLEERGA